MERFQFLVVGGGFRAIAAAWGLAKQGHKTALVEVAPQIGGFMSPIMWGDHWMDKGPQFFDNFEPKDVELMAEMIGPDVMEDVGFRYGSHIAGSSNLEFAIPDWQAFGSDFAVRVFNEILSARLQPDGTKPEFSTFDDMLLWDGGPTLYPHLQAMTRKFLGREAGELSPKTATMVTFLGRKKLFDQDTSLDLKGSSLLDSFLAASKVTVNEARANLYPRGHSLETVRKALEASLDSAGVAVFTNTKLAGIDENKGIAHGENIEIEFDTLFFGTDIRETERLLESTSRIAEKTHLLPEIFHCYLLPVDCVADAYYLVDYEAAHLSTRTTMFCNYMGHADESGLGVVCIEEPIERGSAEWNNAELNQHKVFNEAIASGAIAPCKFVKAKSFRVPVTYKVPLVGIEHEVDAFLDRVARRFGDRAIVPDAYCLTRKSAINDLRSIGIIS